MTRPSLHELLAELGPDVPDGADDGPIDPRWEKLAAGELSDEEASALLAELGTEAEADAFSPLGEDFVQAVTDRAMEALTVGAPAVAPEALPALPPLRPHPELPPPEVRVTRPPAPSRSVWAWLVDLMRQPIFLAPALAVAVALLFVGGSPTPLPPYAMEVSLGDRMDRGGGEVRPGAPRLTSGSALVVVLRPERAVAGVRGAVFVREGGGWSPVPADVDIDPGGAARVRVEVAPSWPVGAVDLRVVLAAGRGPKAADVDVARSGVESFALQVEHVASETAPRGP
jgi:hypothetical protein